nr:MAG TPA: hypothetical protein [Caudoviricetes sp.]
MEKKRGPSPGSQIFFPRLQCLKVSMEYPRMTAASLGVYRFIGKALNLPHRRR